MNTLIAGLVYGWAALMVAPAVIAPVYAKITKGSVRIPKGDLTQED